MILKRWRHQCHQFFGGTVLESIEIEIINWSRFNPRAKIIHPRWFAMTNRLFEDSKFFDFNHGEIVCWLYVLSQASQVNSSVIRINLAHALKFASIKSALLLDTLAKLQKLKCIQIQDHGQHTRVNEKSTTLQDSTVQNKQDSIAQSGDFADFWKGYPRKVGKGKAAKSYWKEIRAGVPHADLCRARDSYAKYCRDQGTEPRFIKHCSTFMTEWKDWLDPETGTAENFSAAKFSSDHLNLDFDEASND